MSRLFIACDLGEELGRVMLGTLHKDQLTISEVHRFPNVQIREKKELFWNTGQLYQDVLTGIREVGGYQEPVDSISCSAWTGDYLLFHSDASFIPPTYCYGDARTEAGRKEVLAKVSWETICEETGVADATRSTLFQLGAEKSKRLKRADHLMPVADGFNFLLSGVPWVEMSSASATQLYNPTTRAWSDSLIKAMDLPHGLLPTIIPAGTKLKPLRPEIAKATYLDNTHVVASCSNPLAAALMALPTVEGESWACLRLGAKTLIGTELPTPLSHAAGRKVNFSHTVGYTGALLCHAETVGIKIIEDFRQAWTETNPGQDSGLLAHMAAMAEPFESLVDLTDSRFAISDGLVEKLQAFCRETGQTVPRKPGAILRCLMESLALSYRRTLDEVARATGCEFTKVYLMGDSSDNILNHFIANALQLPVVVAPPDAAAIGNVVIQAIAMGRIESVEKARQIVQQSFKFTTLAPNPAGTWVPVYDRFREVCGAPAELVPA